MRLPPHVRFRVGPLHVEWGLGATRVGPVWLSDDLHLWWGLRGVHLCARRGVTRRVVFDRIREVDE